MEAGRSDEAEEQEIGRGEVLEFVDEEVAATRLPPLPEGRVGEERLDGPVDLFAVVDASGVVEAPPVGVEGVGEPGHVVA